MIAGVFRLTVSRPPSTSRVTCDAVARHFDLAGKGALRTAGQRGEHLAGLVAVVINRLLAEDDKAGGFFLDNLGEQLGNAQRLDIFGDHQDRAVRTHGERGAQRFLRLCRDRPRPR